MESRVYVDGRFYPASEARVSVFDHGLLYGDGVFEGIRAYNGRVFKLERHVERLYASAKAIGLRIPCSRREMAGVVLDACRQNRLSDGYVRLLVTRGPGDLSLSPQSCRGRASVIAIAQPAVALYADAARTGLKMVTSTHRRVHPDNVSPSIKSLNYLNNVMARMEATARGADEALLLDAQGYVAEAAADNFFIVRGGTIVAPPTSTNLPGITRETVVELAARLGVPFLERIFTQFEAWTADEAFLSGTAAEIVPVRELDARSIGRLAPPGPITARIIGAYDELVRSTGTAIWTPQESADEDPARQTA